MHAEPDRGAAVAAPDFIGVGGHKCASTWLWYNLKQHPDVWVPHLKELHYFDRTDKYPSPGFLSIPAFRHRLLSSSKAASTWRRMAVRDLAGACYKRDLDRLRWSMPFYLGHYDDAWYRQLFSDRFPAIRRARVAGEITPAYSMLDSDDIGHIRCLFPAVRILFLMRDPIDRTWSHIRFDAEQGKLFDIDDWDAVRAYIDSPVVARRADYLHTLDALEEHFPSEQVLLAYDDDVREHPGELLLRVGDFLGIDGQRFPVSSARKTVGRSREMAIPPRVERYLAERYLAMLNELQRRLGAAVVGRWLEHAHRVL